MEEPTRVYMDIINTNFFRHSLMYKLYYTCTESVLLLSLTQALIHNKTVTGESIKNFAAIKCHCFVLEFTGAAH